jgi:two-component system, response regulator
LYNRRIMILIAEDDPDDRLLAQEALALTRITWDVAFVYDGEELLEFMRREGRYAERSPHEPSLILLDLNMPRKDGREALAELKSDPTLRRTPVVVLTTSRTDDDVLRSYDLGVNSYIVKPSTFEALVEVMLSIGKYWCDVVELPSEVGA